jgi:hypothetical protein
VQYIVCIRNFVVGRTGTGFYRRWSIALKKKKTSDRVKAIKSSVG